MLRLCGTQLKPAVHSRPVSAAISAAAAYKNGVACQAQRRVANIDYKRLGMRKNLHEITDLLLDETPRDTRERLKPTQIN